MSMVEPGADATISSGTGDTPDASPPPTGGKLMGMPRKPALVGLGIVGLVAVYLYIKSKNAAATAASASTTGGVNSTTPTLVLPSSSQDAVNGADYASLQGGLNNLSNQVSSLAGAGTAPVPIVTPPATPAPTGTAPTTPTSSGAPPGLSPAVMSAASQGGTATIVGEAFDPINKAWDYLNSLGGVYVVDAGGNPAKSGYYGSYEGLPASVRNVPRTFQSIQEVPGGGYSVVSTKGSSYTFGPQPGQARTA